MPVKLSRWDDHKGSSRGFWLVRQLPGMMLHRSTPENNWALMVSHDFYGLHPQSPRRVWGAEFSTEQAERLLERNPRLQQTFPTRSALLLELEAALEPTLPLTLSELELSPAG